MIEKDPQRREMELTKRWRVTMGPMNDGDRGSVWEGWAVSLDRAIAMSREERRGAFVLGGEMQKGKESEQRKKEVEELVMKEGGEE